MEGDGIEVGPLRFPSPYQPEPIYQPTTAGRTWKWCQCIRVFRIYLVGGFSQPIWKIYASQMWVLNLPEIEVKTKKIFELPPPRNRMNTTPPKTNEYPLKNGWLEHDPFLLKWSLFRWHLNFRRWTWHKLFILVHFSPRPVSCIPPHVNVSIFTFKVISIQ